MPNSVRHVFLDRPQKAHALDSDCLEKLRRGFEELQHDPDLRVVVLGGKGKAFCGGADIAELKSLDASSGAAFVGRIHDVCKAIRDLPVPVIAQLHGAVIGGALEIAAACDLRIAAEGTKFSMPEVKLAIPSVVEAALLPRLMGSGRAAWLVMTGLPIDAARALQWGLVEEVAPAAQLDERLGEVLAALLACEREVLRMQKELCQLWEEAPLPQSIARSIELFAASYKAK